MAFNHAHNFGINKAHFGNKHSITHVHQQPMDAMMILDTERATEATHKSKTAGYAPRCNPKTRREVIADIMQWVEVPAIPKPILWFDGPAGAGKTCIMREVVALCDKKPGITASYFFSTRVAGLSDERPFIATIAHQLAHSRIPGLKPPILQAVSENPTIFRDGMESQMEALVLEPLRACGFAAPSSARKAIIVVDGLDECVEALEREHLLKLLLTLSKELSPSVIVIIASRPELDIRTIFSLSEFKAATHVVRLHDYDGTEDVRIFYCDEFEKIRQTHALKQYIREDWPTEEILQILITKSSGNFIYPAVVMKYITSHPRHNPVKLLEKAMATSPPSDTDNPLAELDALYSLILHPPEVDFPLMKKLLHSIMAVETTTYMSHLPGVEGRETSIPSVFPKDPTPSFLDELFQLSPGTADETFCDLHSILHVGDNTHFHHKSLEDFLLSPRRSNDLYQSRYEMRIDLALVCIEHTQPWVKTPTADHTRIVGYAFHFCISYLEKIFHDRSRTIPPPEAILEFDPRCLSGFLFVGNSVAIPEETIRRVRTALHKTHCTGRFECPPLCKGLHLMSECRLEIQKFTRRYYTLQPEQRLALLPRFKVQTGLYPELSLSEDDSYDAGSPVEAPSGEGVEPEVQSHYLGTVVGHAVSSAELEGELSLGDLEREGITLYDLDGEDNTSEGIKREATEVLERACDHSGLPLGEHPGLEFEDLARKLEDLGGRENAGPLGALLEDKQEATRVDGSDEVTHSDVLGGLDEHVGHGKLPLEDDNRKATDLEDLEGVERLGSQPKPQGKSSLVDVELKETEAYEVSVGEHDKLSRTKGRELVSRPSFLSRLRRWLCSG